MSTSEVIKVEVSDQNIADGSPGDGEACPIANACYDHFNLTEKDYVEVGIKLLKEGDEKDVAYAELNYHDGTKKFFTLSDEAKDFISDFDSDHDVEPFDAELTLHSEHP